jgi:hypothetical protein
VITIPFVCSLYFLVIGFNSLSPLSTVLLHCWVHSGLSNRTQVRPHGWTSSICVYIIASRHDEFVGRQHDWLLHFTVLGCVEDLKIKTASQDPFSALLECCVLLASGW